MAARESEIEETDDVFLASQRISAWADISVPVVWFCGGSGFIWNMVVCIIAMRA
jgi:hypothetical protein